MSKLISLNINPEMWLEDGVTASDVPDAKTTAKKLPFPDESFYLVIFRPDPFTEYRDCDLSNNLMFKKME